MSKEWALFILMSCFTPFKVNVKLIRFSFLKEQFSSKWTFDFKGIVQPDKWKFGHRLLVKNLFEFDKDVIKFTNKDVLYSSIVFFSYYGSQWMPPTSILQNIFFSIQPKKLYEEEYVSNWNFGVNYPFNLLNVRRSKMWVTLNKHSSMWLLKGKWVTIDKINETGKTILIVFNIINYINNIKN